MSRSLQGLTLLAMCGCGGGSAAPRGDSSTSAPSAPLDSGNQASTTGTDSGVTPPLPLYWSLGGQLVLLAGDVDLATSTLELSLWSEAIERVCTLALPLNIATIATPPAAKPAPLSWWSVDHDDGIPLQPGCGVWPAGTLSLGFGRYDSRLDPALDAHEWLGTDLYGLYVEQDAVYVFGVAGTSEQFDGTGATVFAPPVPDGSYELTTLLLLDLP